MPERPAATARRYYSSRKTPQSLTLKELYWKFGHLYLWFRDRDYFKEAGITKNTIPDAIEYEAAVLLSFQPFPITKWAEHDITEDHVFEVLEFLYDRVSKPGEWESMIDGTGYNYHDYSSYNGPAGRAEFRKQANVFLADYKPGYELTAGDGHVVALGEHGLRHILDAEIVPFDEANVDSKVRHAIRQWRDRHSSWEDKKAAIRELADVFEWLKKTKKLGTVLDSKDERALFEIANNFALRHHDPKQKANYDPTIWYAWMFHVYLATYHAAIRLLIKERDKKKQGSGN